MYLARSCFAILFLITVSSTTAASMHPLQRIAGTKLSSLWQGVEKGKTFTLTALAAAMLQFAPLPLDALPQAVVPEVQTQPRLAQGEEYVGKVVFFTAEGVGQLGLVTASDGDRVQLLVPAGPDMHGSMQDEHVILPADHIEALADWDYRVVGNLVTFIPDGKAAGLELAEILVTQGVKALDDGRLVFEREELKEVAFGLVAATTQDNHYVIRPFHHNMFVPDPHDGNTERFAHRHQVATKLATKHLDHLNTDLYLVPQENIFSGLARVVLEETELNTPFFSPLAEHDRKRDANAAAQREGLPLPYAEGVDMSSPAVSAYHTGELTAADFVGKVIYYYEADDSKYVAYAVEQQDDKVAVFLPGGKNKKLIAVEQIRASSLEVEGMLGNGISFVTGGAYPLNHSVYWQGRRLPGARGVLWGGQALDGAVVTVLDNGLMVVKTQIDSDNPLYANYHVYLIHSKNRGLLHYGNHRHQE